MSVLPSERKEEPRRQGPRSTLGDEERRLYALALDHRAPLSGEELRRLSGLGRATVDAALRRLLSLGLLSVDTESQRLAAVSPDTARLRVLAPAVRELDSMQQELDLARLLYDDLATVYQGSMLRPGRPIALEELHGAEAVRSALTALARDVTDELVVSRPGGAQSGPAPQEPRPVVDDLLARGVRVRSLYQHTARFHRRTVDEVARLTARGAEVRTVSGGFTRLTVFDRRTAVIELPDVPDGAVLVREPSVVAFAHLAFEQVWAGGTVFGTEYDPGVVEETTEQVRETIISLLVDGVEDKVIARRLGISLRTCQRHISEIMRRLGARNRLHAGYLLHRRALTLQGRAAG
ncbi:helix-turn-helix transcriptional regulator [Streptomyces coerulescens]|uniref:LuxR C-terminal-related transcriptional regulator n=1 Tax=Streptomyces coerulescens TaxID=29304 RepID=A0ABW0CHM5_STRCD